jgi:hypothetical protein
MANLIDPTEMMFTAFEPKVKNRFVFYVDGLPSYLCRKVTRPKIENGELVIKHINNQRRLKGRSQWTDVTLEMYDPVVPSGAQAVMEWVRLHHESVTGRNGYADFYKKDCTINVLGPVGDKVEEWSLKGAYIKDADFGEMSWEEDGTAVVITMTLGIDYAVLQY